MRGRLFVMAAVMAGLACFAGNAQARGYNISGMIRANQQYQQAQEKAMMQQMAAEQEAQRKYAARQLEKRKAAAEASRKAKDHDRDVAKAHLSGTKTSKSTESKPASKSAKTEKAAKN